MAITGAETMMSLSTLWTPGAFQAARSASRRSTTDRTVPRSVTRDPLVSTVICSASSSAWRLMPARMRR